MGSLGVAASSCRAAAFIASDLDLGCSPVRRNSASSCPGVSLVWRRTSPKSSSSRLAMSSKSQASSSSMSQELCLDHCFGLRSLLGDSAESTFASQPALGLLSSSSRSSATTCGFFAESSSTSVVEDFEASRLGHSSSRSPVLVGVARTSISTARGSAGFGGSLLASAVPSDSSSSPSSWSATRLRCLRSLAASRRRRRHHTPTAAAAQRKKATAAPPAAA
mmetsp:Transcript_8767/g.26963  ORF Transcript_8767/g.26963 Transcript_8767/m.26963 type:complete len:221 (+) Transcript_8767:320-982(+)